MLGFVAMSSVRSESPVVQLAAWPRNALLHPHRSLQVRPAQCFAEPTQPFPVEQTP